MIFAAIDPYILAFSLVTVAATIWVGFWSARKSKTASDFFVAGRSVSVGWNASAISGEYLSAASFMGVAGMVMSSGYDALWYPVCYACGYLFLLLFIAGPLRRFGAYTIPDFAEGRYDSPVFRKIAVVFVLFIGFFYTMPQMKGAGTTLAYIFPGLPYWAGVVLVGAVITLNVALGGMKGITLVQAFQYWAKMFAISVPVFVLMAVYGDYGKQLEQNQPGLRGENNLPTNARLLGSATAERLIEESFAETRSLFQTNGYSPLVINTNPISTTLSLARPSRKQTTNDSNWISMFSRNGPSEEWAFAMTFDAGPIKFQVPQPISKRIFDYRYNKLVAKYAQYEGARQALPVKAPEDFGPANSELTQLGWDERKPAQGAVSLGSKVIEMVSEVNRTLGKDTYSFGPALVQGCSVGGLLSQCAEVSGDRYFLAKELAAASVQFGNSNTLTGRQWIAAFEAALKTNGAVVSHPSSAFGTNLCAVIREPGRVVKVLPADRIHLYQAAGLLAATELQFRKPLPEKAPADATWLNPFGPLTTKAAKAAGLSIEQQRPYSLLYTYSLIIALVCGTAGLPHILVRFYTNPDGVAAKRTTMWVMILIGVFYVFPPIFGVLGRNLLPELYAGVGAKGTDKIVLELPRILNEKYGALGSIMSGITCAGAFAAFMSTFSGLLVSMTGALAHDVYGRMLRPASSPQQRLKAFKVAAVIVGFVAIVLGMQVEPFQINFMVGQAFAIAAASYFPLLFMSAWWKGMTMKGAASGMLGGGVLALLGISLTSFSDLKWIPLETFWAAHPLLRILCEQPAIWTVPLAITLMIVVSKCTRKEIPSDVRMKMLVLHAPEKLGLKQEYIQEHQPGH
jgi:Na+(H+)/acetate symporter ActP